MCAYMSFDFVLKGTFWFVLQQFLHDGKLILIYSKGPVEELHLTFCNGYVTIDN